MADNSNALYHGTIQLPTKPSANLSYTFSPGSQSTNTLVLFLNGLILPQSSWKPTILALKDKSPLAKIPQPHLLSYDRYGQGTSSPHPNGTHDILDIVHDLHTFLALFCSQRLDTTISELRIVLVCNSIGCAIARLFATAYPCTISGMIFLDSIMAHVDLVSLWPDVDTPGFDSRTLPKGTTVEDIRHVREQYKQRFHVSAPNPEDLDKRNLACLLPHADGSRLDGNPFVTAVGHDPETFAGENEKSFGVRKELVMRYIDPVWHQYNQGLALLTSKDKSKGPIIAKGCGHFIQRDDPEFVATEVFDMLRRVEEHE